MTSEGMQALASVDVPQATSAVVASANDFVPANFDTPHAVLVANELMHRASGLNVPHS
jgi:uncharacterized phosphosugar-binding protein